MFNNKVILISGGTGSFGKAFLKEILNKKYKFKKIIVFSRDELKQHEMKISKDFSESRYKKLRYFIGDVRDKDRLIHALQDVDYVIHAAALKQVPTGEYNPFEVIKTNVFGAQNLIDASLQSKVKKIIALSTDKAVSPVNLYGASKLCSDKLFISSNNVKGKKDISFSVVRYGNVTGSRGSVLPEFLKQQKKGHFLITNKSMTRFHISLKESVDMVIWTLKNSIGGEIIIPKISSFKVTDLARAISDKTKFKVIGIRKGEKIHEELLSESDNLDCYDIKKYYVLLSRDQKVINFYKKKFNAKKTNTNFIYNSNINKNFLNIQELKKMIKEFKNQI